ncbi:DUF2231 domain-containing protein [Terrabacter sp. BE26]|uniref:DUF2231 domain-containing protein n=1 Tax=Terrabacter sp. BE26 TaxID=2898152 RepID=UPI0035BE9321
MEPSLTTSVAPPSAASRLLERLVEGRESLDALGATLQPAAEMARGRGLWRRIVTGEILGHAAHPLMTDLPIGFFSSAALLDLAGGPGARDAARRLVGAGLLSAPGAALTGLAEYAPLEKRPKRVAATHAVLNSASLGLYAVSWALRPQRHRAGVAFGMAGLAVSGLSAYLGGHLAIGEKIGTAAPAEEAGIPQVVDAL